MTEGMAGAIGDTVGPPIQAKAVKVIRRKAGATAHNKRYAKAFKRLQPLYKKANGAWKKDGFKRLVKAAHKEAKTF